MTAPNPPAVPDMWWSPTHGAAFYRGGKFYYRMSINPPYLDELPADAVRLVPDTAAVEVRRLQAELAEEKHEHLRTINDALLVRQAWAAREQAIAAEQ